MTSLAEGLCTSHLLRKGPLRRSLSTLSSVCKPMSKRWNYYHFYVTVPRCISDGTCLTFRPPATTRVQVKRGQQTKFSTTNPTGFTSYPFRKKKRTGSATATGPRAPLGVTTVTYFCDFVETWRWGLRYLAWKRLLSRPRLSSTKLCQKAEKSLAFLLSRYSLFTRSLCQTQITFDGYESE